MNLQSTIGLCAGVAACVLATTTSAAPFLKVDFGNSTNSNFEPGFNAQTRNVLTHTTSLGDVTVDSFFEQGNFDRNASGGVNNLLYRDFLFTNFADDIIITLSGPGIAASTDYELTLYSYDSVESRTTTFAPAAGTAGPSLTPKVRTGGDVPDTLDEFAVTGIYTSDSSGVLTIQLVGGRTVINGLEISETTVIPEPSSLALAALGLGAMVARRRRRS